MGVRKPIGYRLLAYGWLVVLSSGSGVGDFRPARRRGVFGVVFRWLAETFWTAMLAAAGRCRPRSC